MPGTPPGDGNAQTEAATYNPDGTIATRTDYAISTTASVYTYDVLGRLTKATSPTFAAGVSVGFAWRVDGLLASRSWSTGPAALVYAYDGAGRVVSSSLNSVARAYTYDPDGNRTSVSVAGVTIDSFAFDTSDETISDTHAGTKTAFTYDRYGNLLSSGTAAAATTAYAYDLADRLDSITQADGSTVGFTFDAAGRHATRISGASTIDTYAYLGTSDSVLQDVSSTAGTINAAIDSAGRSPLQRR